MEDVGIFYVHLVYFSVIWYILFLYGKMFPILVCCSNKNLATLPLTKLQKKKWAAEIFRVCRAKAAAGGKSASTLKGKLLFCKVG
jgi:hypothetical protein